MASSLYSLVLLLIVVDTLCKATESPGFYTLNSQISEEKADDLFKFLTDPRLSIYSKLTNIEELGALDELFDYILTEHSKKHENITKDDLQDLKKQSLEEWQAYSNSSFQSHEATNQFKSFIQPLINDYLDLRKEIPQDQLEKDYGFSALLNDKLIDSIKTTDESSKVIKEVLEDKTRSKPILVKEFAETYPTQWADVLDAALEYWKKEKKFGKDVAEILKELWSEGNGDGDFFKLYKVLDKISKLDDNKRKTFEALTPVTAKYLNEILSLASVINNKVQLKDDIANPLVTAGVAKVVKFSLNQAFEKLKEAKKDTKSLVKLLKSDKVTLFHKFYNISRALPEENVLQSGTKDLEQSGLDRKVMRSFETLIQTYVSQNGKASYFLNRGLSEEDGNLFLADVMNRLTKPQLEQLKGLVPGARKGLEEFIATM
ncbi:unnamed protein product [Bursaphelenchus xylophilus]|uniref:(pine wood nematode) hypothetical protein n=1 Tax=Bursaphelenchus xylophilus TaxID=6326 RepID=A0A1I7RZ47_BURXY|nr:unnamed protein product [Bursaphelenchus xylophilus]CAG9106862.1 unnamed protein product [Bursaphelenchus xylophilus]